MMKLMKNLLLMGLLFVLVVGGVLVVECLYFMYFIICDGVIFKDGDKVFCFVGIYVLELYCIEDDVCGFCRVDLCGWG